MADTAVLSWAGFNVHGDTPSIREVRRLLHEAGTVPDLRACIRQGDARIAQLEAVLAALVGQPADRWGYFAAAAAMDDDNRIAARRALGLNDR